MKKKKVIITAVVIVAAAAIILPRFLKPKEEVAAASVPVVSIQKPEIGNIELYTGLTGTVEPSDIVYIIPKAAGEVTDVYVKAGDYVEEGQELLHIDTKQVDGAKINLDTAAVSLQDANTNLQRMSVLLQSGDISQQQFGQSSSMMRQSWLMITRLSSAPLRRQSAALWKALTWKYTIMWPSLTYSVLFQGKGQRRCRLM